MRRFAPLFCALILLSPTLRTTPAEDFTARGNYKNFGHLGDEMGRAVRLVVDTGLHSMDGKREEAINYFEESTGNPAHDIEIEVDRYIVCPAQTLGHKIGPLKIRALRKYAAKELGQTSDLRSFHDEILKNGTLPMSVLENHMKEWVAKRESA